MNGKLMTAVLKMCYFTKNLYELKDDMQEGVIPDTEEVEHLINELETANNKRISVLKSLGESNLSGDFTQDIVFKDNGRIVDGVLVGPIEGALDFIAEQSCSDDIYMQQVAAYVATCL